MTKTVRSCKQICSRNKRWDFVDRGHNYTIDKKSQIIHKYAYNKCTTKVRLIFNIRNEKKAINTTIEPTFHDQLQITKSPVETNIQPYLSSERTYDSTKICNRVTSANSIIKFIDRCMQYSSSRSVTNSLFCKFSVLDWIRILKLLRDSQSRQWKKNSTEKKFPISEKCNLKFCNSTS